MNRFAAHGIHTAALEGRRILVIGRNGRSCRDSLDQVAAAASEHAVAVRYGNGSEAITYPSGGRVVFRSEQGNGWRGVSADIVYLDDHIEPNDALASVIATSPVGELVRS